LDQNTFNMVVAIAAIIVALSFIVQAFMFAFTYRALQKLSSTAAAVQAKAEPVIEKMGPVIDQIQGTMVSVKGAVDKVSVQAMDAFEKVTTETRAVAAAISVTTQEISGLALHQANQISETMDQATLALARQVAELDHLVTRTQRRIEGTTIEVQETVLEPIREVSALLSGLKRMLEVLFHRGRKPIDQAYQDEELFI
jgi:hypothetical protein